MTDNRDALAELRDKARLQEYQFTSSVPVIGGLIAWFRNAWNSVATKWYVRPVIDQQTSFNLAIVDRLEKVQRSLDATTTDIDTWLIDEDREQTRLARRIAELEIRTRSLERRSGAGSGTTGSAVRPIRIAYFSPLPPARSGIADYSAELLPYLARRAEITLFCDDIAATPVAGLPQRPSQDYLACRDEFDIALYQMGNSEHHETIFELLTTYPGVVVLHDYSLHHFMRHFTRHMGDWSGYGRELAYVLGTAGRDLARDVRDGRVEPPLFEEPLNERLIDVSLGLMVHSEYAAAGIRRRRPQVPLTVIPALVESHEGRSLREQLGLPEDVVLFGSFGQLTAEKQPELALRAFSRMRETHPNYHYVFVGETMPDIGHQLDAWVDELGLSDIVHRVGHVAELSDFIDWITTVDVVVNLRYPTVGETSAVALRSMAAARPLIVYDHGWYSEIPDSIALKIPPLDFPGLQEAMARLAGSADLRRSMGMAGQAYAREVNNPERVADAYISFLSKIVEHLDSIPA